MYPVYICDMLDITGSDQRASSLLEAGIDAGPVCTVNCLSHLSIPSLRSTFLMIASLLLGSLHLPALITGHCKDAEVALI